VKDNEFVGRVKIENSLVQNSEIGKGRIINSIVINCEIEDVDIKNSLVIGCQGHKLISSGAIVYHLVDFGLRRANPGDVWIDLFHPREGQIRFLTDMSRDGNKDWDNKMEEKNNPYRYAEMDSKVRGIDPEEAEEARAKIVGLARLVRSGKVRDLQRNVDEQSVGMLKWMALYDNVLGLAGTVLYEGADYYERARALEKLTELALAGKRSAIEMFLGIANIYRRAGYAYYANSEGANMRSEWEALCTEKFRALDSNDVKLGIIEARDDRLQSLYSFAGYGLEIKVDGSEYVVLNIRGPGEFEALDDSRGKAIIRVIGVTTEVISMQAGDPYNSGKERVVVISGRALMRSDKCLLVTKLGKPDLWQDRFAKRIKSFGAPRALELSREAMAVGLQEDGFITESTPLAEAAQMKVTAPASCERHLEVHNRTGENADVAASLKRLELQGLSVHKLSKLVLASLKEKETIHAFLYTPYLKLRRALAAPYDMNELLVVMVEKPGETAYIMYQVSKFLKTEQNLKIEEEWELRINIEGVFLYVHSFEFTRGTKPLPAGIPAEQLHLTQQELAEVKATLLVEFEKDALGALDVEVGESFLERDVPFIDKPSSLSEGHPICARGQREAPKKYKDIAGDLGKEFVWMADDILAIVRRLVEMRRITLPLGMDPLDFELARHSGGKMYWADGITEDDVRYAIRSLFGDLHFDEDTIIEHINAHEREEEEEYGITAQAELFRLTKGMASVQRWSSEIALIGVGRWGARLLKVLRELFPGIIIHAVCGSNYDAWLRFKCLSNNIRIYNKNAIHRVLSNPNIRAVIIATQSDKHCWLAKQALLAGKDVLVEKPFTSTSEEANELIALAKEKGLLLAVDYEFMHDHNINLLRQAIIDGDLGRIERVELDYLNPLVGRSINMSANVIGNAGSHMFSIAQLFFGRRDVQDLKATGMDEDAWRAKVDFKCAGAEVSINVDDDYQRADRKRVIIVRGSTLTIRLDFQNGNFEIQDKQGQAVEVDSSLFPQCILQGITGNGKTALALALEAFFHAAQNRYTHLVNSAENTRWVSGLIDRVNGVEGEATERAESACPGDTDSLIHYISRFLDQKDLRPCEIVYIGRIFAQWMHSARAAAPDEKRMSDIVRVVHRLYLNPSITAEELCGVISCSREEIIEIFSYIRGAYPIQRLFLKSSRHSRFFDNSMFLCNDCEYLADLTEGREVFPWEADLQFSWHCQLDCVECYNQGGGYEDRPGTYLTKDEACRILQGLKEAGVKVVNFTGGKEPSLRPSWVDEMEYAYQIGLEFQLFSNGIALGARAREALLNARKVKISLDAATPDTYARTKRRPQSSGFFESAVLEIKDLVALKQERGSDVKIGISMVATKKNFREIVDFIELGWQLGVDFVDISYDYVNMTPEFSAADRAELKSIIEEARLRVAITGPDKCCVIFKEGIAKFEKDGVYSESLHQAEICEAHNYKMAIDPKGNFSICCYGVEPGCFRTMYNLGNIRDNEWDVGRLLKKNLEREVRVSDCRGCHGPDVMVNILVHKLKQDLAYGVGIMEQPFMPLKRYYEWSASPAGAPIHAFRAIDGFIWAGICGLLGIGAIILVDILGVSLLTALILFLSLYFFLAMDKFAIFGWIVFRTVRKVNPSFTIPQALFYK
ncbi:MAG: Gfo/Idh/MocA family oxidoreductase, partial [Candidatus Pacebacteria bacterium]|nr:Gfo/Idh/MocA family oxidoreductase [Candidatus Paceibacterota bacterium]